LLTTRSDSRDCVEILLVEDNPGDVRLTREVLSSGKLRNRLTVAADGVEAINYLRHRGRFDGARRPDLVLLDLNLPRKDGREVLAEIKSDPELKLIPVVILTTSAAAEDVTTSYSLQANCYITKPVEFEQFTRVISNIQDFWLTIVELPPE
jgi:two-component system, chemotaxis family, response regulator Rcp1